VEVNVITSNWYGDRGSWSGDRYPGYLGKVLHREPGTASKKKPARRRAWVDRGRLGSANYKPAAIYVRLVRVRSLVFKTNDNRTRLDVQ